MKKILITGSSGTIGTRLGEKLLNLGYEIIGVDWKKNKWHKNLEKKNNSFGFKKQKFSFKKIT
jgi:nucleoside-diphosphate-sugar epimerase